MDTTINAIRIHCHQTLVNYRKPGSYEIQETYPLPPYSTIIGMIHNACGFSSYHPLKISVQGENAGTVANLYTKYTFSGAKYKADRHNLCVKDTNQEYGVFRGIGISELITEIDLYIHIVPENEDDFETIYNGLKHPKKFLSLGRHEDLLDIVAISKVECKRQKIVTSQYDTYVPYSEELDQDSGTVYRVFKEYTINPKTNIRRFAQPILVKCMGKDCEIEECYQDELDLPVVLV